VDAGLFQQLATRHMDYVVTENKSVKGTHFVGDSYPLFHADKMYGERFNQQSAPVDVRVKRATATSVDRVKLLPSSIMSWVFTSYKHNEWLVRPHVATGPEEACRTEYIHTSKLLQLAKNPAVLIINGDEALQFPTDAELQDIQMALQKGLRDSGASNRDYGTILVVSMKDHQLCPSIMEEGPHVDTSTAYGYMARLMELVMRWNPASERFVTFITSLVHGKDGNSIATADAAFIRNHFKGALLSSHVTVRFGDDV